MALPLAHFTPAELPGTVAIFVIGVFLGISLSMHRFRIAAVFAGTLVIFVSLALAADLAAWPAGARLTIDGFAGIATCALGVRLIWPAAPNQRGN